MDQSYTLNQEHLLRVVYPKEHIASEVSRLAEEINAAYAGRELLVIVVLKGALFFAADLLRGLRIPVRVDFVKLSSYDGTMSSGQVQLTKDLDSEVAGRDVLVVEDIIDTGLTLSFLVDLLHRRGVGTLRVCTLIDKKERRQTELEPDFAGFHCPGGFLVGYGLDYNERLRELPSIFEVVENNTEP
ncbi:MAG TPA: hypoxanthine phosphoribosyltransferase [Geomonas sp.]|nr:hypoxanthine phosphoribosyltransferase [Geomonas sp.]